MKETWKKICIIILGLLFLIIPITALGASGTISISGPNQVVAGNQVNVTVTLSSGTKIGSWKMLLNYDSSMLQLNGTTAENSTTMGNSSASGTTSVSYNYTFTALKSGTTTVSVGSYEVYAFDDFSSMSISRGSKSISIVTKQQIEEQVKKQQEEEKRIQEAKSKNNYLSKLEVEKYEITPEFDKETLEYLVTVPEGTKKINIIATPEDNKATVYYDGEKELKTDEENKFEIIVVSEYGTEKSYIVKVDIIDKDPINVKVDGKKYTVVKNEDLLTKPEGFKKTTTTIDGKKVPSFYSKKLGITLVGLKDEKGKIALYQYDNGKYIKYIELIIGNVTLLPEKIKDSFKGYKKYTTIINGNEVEVLSKNKDSRLKLINANNKHSKDKGYYLYDSKDNTVIKYDANKMDKILKQNELLKYASIIFGATSLISLISLLVVASKKSKKAPVVKEEQPKKEKKAKKEKIVEEEIVEEQVEEEKPKKEKKSKKTKKVEVQEEPVEDVNEIKELEETEVYDIFEDDKPKKKRKRK